MNMISIPLYVFGLKDFNGVGHDFVRRTVLPEMKMSAKKSETSEDVHATKL